MAKAKKPIQTPRPDPKVMRCPEEDFVEAFRIAGKWWSHRQAVPL